MYCSVTPSRGSLSTSPGLQESTCRVFLDLGRLLLHSLDSSSRKVSSGNPIKITVFVVGCGSRVGKLFGVHVCESIQRGSKGGSL